MCRGGEWERRLQGRLRRPPHVRGWEDHRSGRYRQLRHPALWEAGDTWSLQQRIRAPRMD